AFGLGEGIVHGVAYEGNVAYGVVPRERYARRAVVELADIPGGYGWVFAKGDHVNVGVAAGLIDPVSGDGMYECFVSARLASAAVVDLLGGRSSSLAGYGVAVDVALSPLHRASWKLKH